MKFTKRIITSLLCFILLLSMLVSCAGGKKTDGSTDAGTEAAQPGADESTALVTEEPPYVPVVSKWVSAIYGGGPFVTGGTKVHEAVKASGFNTLMIWSLHIHEDGTLYLNDVLVAKDGEFMLKFPKNAKDKKLVWDGIIAPDSSITRIELSIGAWGCGDFENIRTIMNRDGDGEDTMLYKNLKMLMDTTGAVAFNFDDESCYDVNAMTKFGKMCEKMGAKVTLCPYTNMSFWKQLKDNLGDNCDRIYLQCYDGGAWNNPADWTKGMGMEVIPGYWCIHNGTAGDSAAKVKEKLKNAGKAATGAFMWLYDDMKQLTGANATEKYAEAINSCNPEK